MRVIFHILTLMALVSVAQPAQANAADGTMVSVLWARWGADEDLMTFDVFESLLVESNPARSIEFEVSPWTGVPLVYYRLPDGEGGEKDVLTYNFRAPVNLLAAALTAKLGGHSWRDLAQLQDSPWRFVLFAPDCRARFRLVGNLKLMVGTRTDYMLYRTADTERGILFTPQIGLDFSGGDYGAREGYGGISVSVGYRNWWNFDGDSRSGGLAVFVRVWGMPVTP